MIAMLADKYEQAVRNSELNEAERKGEERGRNKGIKLGEERGKEQGIKLGMQILILDNIEEGIAEDRIIAKLQKRYQLSEEEAKAAVKKYRE